MAESVEVKMPVKVKPFEHQKKAFAIGTTIPYAGLLMEQGCGKSLTSVAIAGHRFLHDGLKRVLVVAPTSVVPVWPREFNDYADFPFEVRALTGSSKEKSSQLLSWKLNPDVLQVAVVNYESTWRMEEALTKWLKEAVSMVIADESQRIKTPGATQSKCMHRLGKLARFRLILTGTPVTQSPLDFYSQYKFLDESIFGTSFVQFRNRYAIMGGFENRQVVSYKNMDELVQKAHSIAYRVSKAEALDLPDEITQPLYVELSKETRNLYNQLKKEAIADLEAGGTITANIVLTKLLRLSQIAGGFVTDEDGQTHKVGDEKLKVFEETLEDLLDAGKKVVVFARFIPEIEAILQVLDKLNVKYGYITGAVSQTERGEVVKRFQTDPNCKVFVAQIQTAGLGITLTAADTAIFYSMDFSLANHEQAKARIHRIGQKNNVTYIYLLAKDTVDEKIFAALKSKKNVADAVVDDWQDFFDEQQSTGHIVHKPRPVRGKKLEANETVTIEVIPEPTPQPEPEKVIITIPVWLAQKHGITTQLSGVITKEVGHGVYFVGNALATPSIVCRICGRRLDNKESQKIGIGPDCLEKVGGWWNHRMTDEELAELKKKVESIKFEGWLPKSQIAIQKQK
jgi:SNF2 family DNA or RNA helicase